MKLSLLSLIIPAVLVTSCGESTSTNTESTENGTSTAQQIQVVEEVHLNNVHQLTTNNHVSKTNWNADGSLLLIQASSDFWRVNCDQVFAASWWQDDLINGRPRMLSSGNSLSAGGQFMPGDSTILMASNKLTMGECPRALANSDQNGYTVSLEPSLELIVMDLDGNIIQELTKEDGYDSEASVSPKGDKIVFTSMRSGDPEIFTMNIDGTGVKQISFGIGYDGGACFSPDGSKIVFSASHLDTEKELDDYMLLLEKNLVAPTKMELFICNTDGSGIRQLTALGGANWVPVFHPNGHKIIFASNHQNTESTQLYSINIDGTELAQITFNSSFNAFPSFSNDGKFLSWASHRNNNGSHASNLFIAEWRN